MSHLYHWLLVQPGKVVVLCPVVDGVARGRGRRLGWGIVVQLVAIVTNADLKLYRLIVRVDHGGREECSEQFVLAPAKERGEPLEIDDLNVLRLGGGKLAEGHLHFDHNTTTVGHALNQSLVEVLKLVWEVTELSWRTIAVDETGSKARQKTCTQIKNSIIHVTVPMLSQSSCCM